MNEHSQNPVSTYILTKFDHDPRRIAFVQAVMRLCPRMDRGADDELTDKLTIWFQYTPFQLFWAGV